MISDTLVVIPARKGSKGIKNKNIKKLNSDPLIKYTIDFALKYFKRENIFVSTNSNVIIHLADKCGIKIPYKRPEHLCTDASAIQDTLLHTINYFEKQGIIFEKLIMLQPTSPFRKKSDLINIYSLYTDSIDMVVSVVKSKSNPYFNLYEEDKNGFLIKSNDIGVIRRQDCPSVFQLNGSIYLYNIQSIKEKRVSEFQKIIKYQMDQEYSIDIDDEFDWEIAEFLSKKGLPKYE